MRFSDLREANVARDRECYGHLKEWSVNDYGVAVAGEVGELCNLLKKRRRGDSIPDNELKDEIADVAIYLDLLSEKLGFSLHNCIVDKFNAVSDKKHTHIKVS